MIEYSEEQVLAIEAPLGVIRIMAGPGSGKTAVVTSRIHHLIENEHIVPSEILSVSFTVKAVDELRLRLTEQLGEIGSLVEIKTIHALCLSIYIDHLLSKKQPLTFAIQEGPESVALAIQATLSHFSKDPSFPEEWLYPEAVLTIIRQLKQSDPESLLYEQDRHDVQLVHYFDQQLQKSGTLTFDDLGPIALRALTENAQLRQARQKRHRAIFVDEAQDLNTAQFAILKALCGSTPCMTLVGDDDQCIYAWRGAVPEQLRALEHHFPDALTYTLSQNYRCPDEIVRASSALISNNSYRFPKSLTAAKVDPTAQSPIRVYHDDDANRELHRVSEHVARLIQSGVQPEQIAILNRHNNRSKQLQMALLAKKLPVVFDNPLLTPSGQRLLGLVYVLYEGIESTHFGRIIDLGVKRLGKSMLRSLFPEPPTPEAVGPFLSKWCLQNPKHPLSLLLIPLFEIIQWARSQPPRMLAQTWQHLCTVLKIPQEPTGLSHEDELSMAYQSINELCLRHAHSLVPLPSVLAEAEANKLGGPRHQRGIHVLSLHRAKGLEFDHVFIMGVQPGILPTGKSMFNAQRLEEERRLFYVGMTRARQQLYLSHYGARLPILNQLDWGGFIEELPSDLIHHVGHSPEQHIRYA